MIDFKMALGYSKEYILSKLYYLLLLTNIRYLPNYKASGQKHYLSNPICKNRKKDQESRYNQKIIIIKIRKLTSMLLRKGENSNFPRYNTNALNCFLVKTFHIF